MKLHLSNQILIPFHSKNIISQLNSCIEEIKKIQNSNKLLSCVTFIKNEKERKQDNNFVILGEASTLKVGRSKSPNHSN